MTYETKIKYDPLQIFKDAGNAPSGDKAIVYGLSDKSEQDSINDALKNYSDFGYFPHQILSIESKEY
tara:strand:+ start:199 stop:399 length:201 start_codon:yes stop_codon:yes gene_type:complete